MNTRIFKVISQGEPQTYQKQDGTTGDKCPITLQEFGAYKDDCMFVGLILGDAARQQWKPGDIVAARLRFTAHLYEGRTYQDVFVTAIMKVNK